MTKQKAFVVPPKPRQLGICAHSPVPYFVLVLPGLNVTWTKEESQHPVLWDSWCLENANQDELKKAYKGTAIMNHPTNVKILIRQDPTGAQS